MSFNLKGRRAVLALAIAVLGQSAWATPSLQVYIDGGTYDVGTQTWVTGDQTFTLSTLATNTGTASFTDATLAYLSIALDPSVDPTSGSISVNGATIDTSAFVFGRPPVGYDTTPPNNDSLATHSVYDTWYYEYGFALGTACTACVTDMTSPGTAVDGWVNNFDISISGFDSAHFDLYTVKTVGGYPAIDEFAPFSHDGEYRVQVTEPSSLALLGIGLLGGLALRKYRRSA